MFRKSEVVTTLGSATFLKKSGKKSRKKLKGEKKLSAKFEWHLLGSVQNRSSQKQTWFPKISVGWVVDEGCLVADSEWRVRFAQFFFLSFSWGGDIVVHT